MHELIQGNLPEKHQLLLVLVLPQKGHQVVELVLRSTYLQRCNFLSLYFFCFSFTCSCIKQLSTLTV